jgi:hypothetical protein
MVTSCYATALRLHSRLGLDMLPIDVDMLRSLTDLVVLDNVYRTLVVFVLKERALPCMASMPPTEAEVVVTP